MTRRILRAIAGIVVAALLWAVMLVVMIERVERCVAADECAGMEPMRQVDFAPGVGRGR